MHENTTRLGESKIENVENNSNETWTNQRSREALRVRERRERKTGSVDSRKLERGIQEGYVRVDRDEISLSLSLGGVTISMSGLPLAAETVHPHVSTQGAKRRGEAGSRARALRRVSPSRRIKCRARDDERGQRAASLLSLKCRESARVSVVASTSKCNYSPLARGELPRWYARATRRGSAEADSTLVHRRSGTLRATLEAHVRRSIAHELEIYGTRASTPLVPMHG